jgi:hypothetical protein
MKAPQFVPALALVTLASILSHPAVACEDPNNSHPHATGIRRIDANTIRVLRPHHIIRYGGGAPGKVYYSGLASKRRVCRALVTKRVRKRSGELTFTTLEGQYVRGSATYTDERLPTGLSGFVYYVKDFIGNEPLDFSEYTESAPFRDHAIESIDCQVEDPAVLDALPPKGI